MDEDKKKRLYQLLVARKHTVHNSTSLSISQRAMWHIYRSDPGSHAYNIPLALKIERRIDLNLMQVALGHLTSRHQALRIVFFEMDGEIHQVESADARHNLHVVDAKRWSNKQVCAAIQRATCEPFALDAEPAFRFVAFSMGSDGLYLLIVSHHILADGVSVLLLGKELMALYEALEAGVDANLPPTGSSYADFVRYQRELVMGSVGDAQWSYWQRELEGELPHLDLMLDFPRPPTRAGKGGTCWHLLGHKLVNRVSALSKQSNCTLFTTMLSAFFILLHRYSGQYDLLVGVPLLGRPDLSFQSTVGYFTDPGVVRLQLHRGATCRSVLRATSVKLAGAIDNQGLPFAEVVRRLNPPRTPGRTAVFEASFDSWNLGVLDGGIDGVAYVPTPSQESAFDLAVDMVMLSEGISLQLGYNKELFEASTAERMLESYELILRALVDDPDREIETLPIHPKDGARRVARDFWSCEGLAQDEPTVIDIARACPPAAARVVVYELPLPAGIAEQMAEFAAARELEPLDLVRGALALVLSRYTSQDAVLFGVVPAQHPENIVPVVMSIEHDLPIAGWVKKQAGRHQERLSHAHLPLTEIQRVSGIQCDKIDVVLNEHSPSSPTELIWNAPSVNGSAAVVRGFSASNVDGSYRGRTKQGASTTSHSDIRGLPGPRTGQSLHDRSSSGGAAV